jgi:hypothetical protein
LSRLPGLFLELIGTGILLVWGVAREPGGKEQQEAGKREREREREREKHMSELLPRLPHCVQRKSR